MNEEYMTINQYFDCKSKLIGEIATYDLLIKGVQDSLRESILSGIYSEYELDDGQIKCRTKYRSIDQMVKGLQGLRTLRQDCINQYNGRGTRLVGGSL